MRMNIVVFYVPFEELRIFEPWRAYGFPEGLKYDKFIDIE